MDATATLIAAVIVRKADELLSNWVAPVARVYYRQAFHQTEYLMPFGRPADLPFARLLGRGLRPRHFKPGNRTFRVVGETDSVDTVRRLQLFRRHHLALVVACHYSSVDGALHLAALD